MSVLLSINGSLGTTTANHSGGGYVPVTIGEPVAVKLLTFFPGMIKNDWGGKAELMISSQVRLGPSNTLPPRLVNMMLRNYDFKKASPIQDYGGDVYGDPMLYYTKSYAGQRLGVTLRGVEMDKVDDKVWNGVTGTISTLGKIALFAPAAPYLAGAAVIGKIFKSVLNAAARNDRLLVARKDFHFNAAKNQRILQSARYVFWDEKKSFHHASMKARYKLTGTGDYVPNVLVSQTTGEPFTYCPYFVVQIDAIKRKEYEDFEIGAGSAKLLETWGNKELGVSIFTAVNELASHVNDAKQLSSIRGFIKDLKNADSDDEKKEFKAKIEAHSNLFTEENADLLKGLLGDYLK